MSQTQTPEEWARSANLTSAPKWGAIEDQVLRRRPKVEQSGSSKVIRVIGLIVVVALAIPTFGSGIIGMVLALVEADPRGTRLFFVLATLMPVSLLVIWWDDRARGPVKITLGVVSGLAALVAYLVLRSMPTDAADGWSTLLALSATIVGIGSAVLMVVASRKQVDAPRRRRWSISPAKDIAYVKARSRVLEILVERGQVTLDPDQMKRMGDMQLGTWYKLDRPD